jgi:DnaK suppressor protein
MSDAGETRASKEGERGKMTPERKERKTKRKSTSAKREGFRSRFLATLLTKKEDVENALSRLMDGKREYKDLVSEDAIVEELDHAEREIAIQKHYSLLERKHRELEKIEYLIQRIQEEDDEFGRCEECGRRIPEERLLIVPDATRCVPCQRELEKFDSRRSLAERSYTPTGVKKDLRWEEKEESNDQGELTIKPDIEHLSFTDLDETDIDNNVDNK